MRVVLADREAEIMQVLWEHGPSTVTEVRERLKDDLAYTTVLTILRNLEAKEYVGPSKDGRAHRYAPLISSESARRSALRDLSAKLFKGSAELLLTHFVADQKLSDEEIERIQKMLNERRKKDKHQKGVKK
ncbi:MAG TPA: BlaI/MecI/CopY family transcriptional regulator [Steroidobacteraceae bacterium]|nr:BlaI/MecI/CopY family transcriptional regulator [Steroidobacteraceae bacterium]